MDFFGTEKFFQNRTSSQNYIDFDDRNLKELFMDQENVDQLATSLRHFGMVFEDLELRAKMGVWAKKNKVEFTFNYDRNSTKQNDNSLLLKAINSKFIESAQEFHSTFHKPLHNKICAQKYKNIPVSYSPNPQNYNDVFDSETVIQDGVLQKSNYDEPDHRVVEHKSTKYMTANDFRNMDVYDSNYDRDLYTQTIGLSIKRQRRNDMQKYMHKRHTQGFYEGGASSEGFRVAEADRASLDNLSRGFSMQKFIKNANNLKRPESRNQFQI